LTARHRLKWRDFCFTREGSRRGSSRQTSRNTDDRDEHDIANEIISDLIRMGHFAEGYGVWASSQGRDSELQCRRKFVNGTFSEPVARTIRVLGGISRGAEYFSLHRSAGLRQRSKRLVTIQRRQPYCSLSCGNYSWFGRRQSIQWILKVSRPSCDRGPCNCHYRCNTDRRES